MRFLRVREPMSLTQSHTVDKQHDWDLSPQSLTPDCSHTRHYPASYNLRLHLPLQFLLCCTQCQDFQDFQEKQTQFTPATHGLRFLYRTRSMASGKCRRRS